MEKQLKRAIYKILIGSIDLVEFLYLKLKYFKSHYKNVLIDIFEEKDQSTHQKSEFKPSNNQYVKAIIGWLGNLFGTIEEEIVFEIHNCKQSAHKIIRFSQFSKPISILVFISISLFIVMIHFLLKSHFT